MSADWNERLYVPWTWHAGLVVGTVLLGAEIAQALPPRPAVLALPFLALLALGEALFWRNGRTRVRIDAGTIEVGNWRLPLAQVRSVEPLQGRASTAALRRPDGTDYRLIRGWIHGLVRLEVDDPEDRPVWLFSTRSPEAVTAALVRARQAALPLTPER